MDVLNSWVGCVGTGRGGGGATGRCGGGDTGRGAGGIWGAGGRGGALCAAIFWSKNRKSGTGALVDGAECCGGGDAGLGATTPGGGGGAGRGCGVEMGAPGNGPELELRGSSIGIGPF